jgi:hypothetical protein
MVRDGRKAQEMQHVSDHAWSEFKRDNYKSLKFFIYIGQILFLGHEFKLNCAQSSFKPL